ncbi:hypothetical protein EI94DRAFT_1751479, partial [Lactarius quietus]
MLSRRPSDPLASGYACPAADAVPDAFEAVLAWRAHLSESMPLTLKRTSMPCWLPPTGLD